MVGRALSERVKKLAEAKAAEQRLHDATKAYRDAKAKGNSVSYRKLASKFRVKKSNLQRCVEKTSMTMAQFNATKQRLTISEEEVLKEFIIESASRGFPQGCRNIQQFANCLCQARLGTDCERVSDVWVERYLDRHRDSLQTHWTKPLNTQRARSLNPAAVNSWFDIVEEFIVKAGILPENLYGMDESGFPMAYAGKERVVGARGTKTQHKQGGADRENVTGVVTICADGTTIKPLLIFKGKNMKEAWAGGNSIGAW